MDAAPFAEIVRRLAKAYGPLKVPEGGPPLDELVLTILSQHTSDANAERAFHALRAAFPTWEGVLAAHEAAVADAGVVPAAARSPREAGGAEPGAAADDPERPGRHR